MCNAGGYVVESEVDSANAGTQAPTLRGLCEKRGNSEVEDEGEGWV